MATLQKFKFLATQCAVIGSPTRSPTTSPVVHLRRRKTLRMLLGRTGNSNHQRRFHRRDGSDSPDPPRAEEMSVAEIDNDVEEEVEHRRRQQQHHHHQICVRHKLKDLFVSSPPPLADESRKMDVGEAKGLVPDSGRVGGGAVVRIGSGAMRPLSATLRQRLLRRAWRPVLVAIPEQSP